jgi:hypothetical protein
MMREMLEGWVVLRQKPWDFRGPFPDMADAVKLAKTLNGSPSPEYEVKWGCRPRGELPDSELKFWKKDGR